MRIELFTYTNPLKDGKLRPGFRLGEKLFVLTHTRPQSVVHVLFPSTSVNGEHFKSDGRPSYLMLATDQGACRYNDNPGGTLEISDAKTRLVERGFEVSLKEYLFTV